MVILSLTACATPTVGDMAAPGAGGEPSSAPSPSVDSEEAAAHAQAQEWLDTAVLPPAAVRSEANVGAYGSYTGWPCGPIVELEGYWTIPGANVRDTANWLVAHPTPGLVTTNAPLPDGPEINGAVVGHIPEPGAQEGVVFSIAEYRDGVVVRAEVAALTASAECPPVPGGGDRGPPGQG